PYACASDYVDVTDSICTGTTPCYAGSNSTIDQFSHDHGWAEGTPPPTPTPTPRGPGCCAFRGINQYGATCVDNTLIGGDSGPVSLDFCHALAQQLSDDEVVYFNPDASCSPTAGDYTGTCPSPDPNIPAVQPQPNGCCVLDSQCTGTGIDPLPI